MKKYIKTVIMAILVIAVIVGCYYQMTHRKTVAAEDTVEVTQLQKVISRQLDSSYQPTPREVIKFYNLIIECAYGDEYDTGQFEKLTTQARKLMDEELLENNPTDTYKSQLLQEIASYKDDSRKILQTRVCNSDEVRYREVKGQKYAYVQAVYFMKQGSKEFLKTCQDYLLRQDQDKKWKIVACHLSQEEDES